MRADVRTRHVWLDGGCRPWAGVGGRVTEVHMDVRGTRAGGRGKADRAAVGVQPRWHHQGVLRNRDPVPTPLTEYALNAPPYDHWPQSPQFRLSKHTIVMFKTTPHKPFERVLLSTTVLLKFNVQFTRAGSRADAQQVSGGDSVDVHDRGPDRRCPLAPVCTVLARVIAMIP